MSWMRPSLCVLRDSSRNTQYAMRERAAPAHSINRLEIHPDEAMARGHVPMLPEPPRVCQSCPLAVVSSLAVAAVVHHGLLGAVVQGQDGGHGDGIVGDDAGRAIETGRHDIAQVHGVIALRNREER